MNTAIITTINPHSKIELQKNCFEKWKEIGYIPYSYNVDAEKEMLLSAGLDHSDIINVKDEDTSIELNGKKIPRILPLLKDALNRGHSYYLLTNSDIYPAHNNVASNAFSSIAASFIFTRKECFNIYSDKFHHDNYYRGGLDVFWFSREELLSVVNKLSCYEASERMTFGVPGWDFFLAHILCTYFNTPILDGGIFLHPTHETTYSSISEFECFAQEMQKSKKYENRDHISLAAEFANLIEDKCENSKEYSNLIKVMLYKNDHSECVNSVFENCRVKDVAGKYSYHLDSLQIKSMLCLDTIVSIIDADFNSNKWHSLNFLIDKYNTNNCYKIKYLQIMLLELLRKVRDDNNKLTTIYPKGNKHNLSMRNISAIKSADEKERNVFNLVASELLDYGIINKNLLKYLGSCLKNRDEQKLFHRIVLILKKEFIYA